MLDDERVSIFSLTVERMPAVATASGVAPTADE